MSVHESTELAEHLLRYQTLYLSILRYMQITSPDFQQKDHIDMLKTIWDKARIEHEQQSVPSEVNWARLGLDTADDMFAGSGVLGLLCLVSFEALALDLQYP